MSKQVKEKGQPYIHIWYTADEKIGTFWQMECDIHGTTWMFTDKSGADNCIECIKDLAELDTPKGETK